MRKPYFSIQERSSDRDTCTDCGGATARVTGHRGRYPLCDVCLLEQNPQLGKLVATQSAMEALVVATKPPRPRSRTVLRMVSDHARDLKTFFNRSWSVACDAEMKLATRYNLRMLEERARVLGGDRAARRFDDLRWVRRTIKEAERRRVNVKGYLLIKAIESVGESVGSSSRRAALLESTDSAIFG